MVSNRPCRGLLLVHPIDAEALHRHVLEDAEETWQRSKVSLNSGFQIADHVMFSVMLAVRLIIRVAGIFAQNQFN